MDPDGAMFAFLLVLLFVFYVAYFLARIHLFSSIVLALIIGALALSVLCPLTLFNKTKEEHNSTLAFLIIYGITVLVVFLYIVVKVSQDVRYESLCY